MAQLDRAALKAFFETGDKPTESQFSDLIDSLLSLLDNSNLAEGIKIKSATNGKIQFEISDDFLGITSDGDNWNTCYILLEPGQIELFAGDAGLTIAFDGIVNLASAVDKELTLLSGNGNGFSIIKDSVSGKTRVKLNNLGTYANNAAALADGREVKEVYKTVTGELRIVV